MAGLLDDLGSFSGDDTVKDQYGQTQADRRKPLWSGLINAGLLAVAGGGNLMPADRAKYIAGAGQALGGIGPAMQEQQQQAAQNLLRQQQVKNEQQKLGLQTLTEQQKLDLARQEFALKQRVADQKLGAPTLKEGNWHFPNGNVYNELTGWKYYNGQIVPDGQGHSIAPAPGQTASTVPTSTAPAQPAVPPDATSPDINKRTAASDEEINQWSNIKPNAGIPHNLQPSPLDEPRNYAALRNLDPSSARIVQQVGDYETEPGNAFGKYANPALSKLVNDYNPNFNKAKYKLINDENKEYGTGATGKSMLAMDTSYAHIGSLWKQYEALSGPDTPLARQALQEWQRRTGAPSTAGFDVARSAVADEVAKAMRGGGALNKDEQEDWQKKYNPTQSPEQMQRAVVETMELLEGKEKALKNKYKTDTGLTRKDFLSPENKQMAEYIRTHPLGGTKPAAPAPAGAAGSGTTPKPGFYADPDGVWRNH